MELSGVDVQAASAACHSLEWSRSTPTAMNLVTASSADSSKSPFAGAKPRRSLESISQEDQAASPARRSKRATTGIDYAVVATGRVPAKKSKPSAAPGSRAAPEAASVDSPAPSSARQRQDDLAQPATQKKARYLRYCDAVYTLFSEAAASKQLAPWESLTGDYREELFSKVLECQVSQPARGGSVDKAEAMRNLRDSHEHLEWAASQWAAALQKALDKQGQGQGQGQAAPHVQHGAAELRQSAGLSGSSSSSDQLGPAASKIAASQMFTYQKHQRTIFEEPHAIAVAAILDESLLNEKLLRADKPAALKALAAEILPKLPDGLIRQQLGDADRLAVQLKKLRMARLERRNIDAMSDFYFRCYAHPSSLQAKLFENSKNKRAIPDLHLQCFQLAMQLGAWKIQD